MDSQATTAFGLLGSAIMLVCYLLWAVYGPTPDDVHIDPFTVPRVETPSNPFSSYSCSGPIEGVDAHLFRTCHFSNLYVFHDGLYFYYNDSLWSMEYMANLRRDRLLTMNRPTGLPGTSREWGHKWAPLMTPTLPQTGEFTSSTSRTVLYFEPNDADNFGHALMDDLLPLFTAYDRVMPLEFLDDKPPLCLTMLESKTTPVSLLLKLGRELVDPVDFGKTLEEHLHPTHPSQVFRIESLVAGTGTLADHPYEKNFLDYNNGRQRGAVGFMHGRSSVYLRTFRWLAREAMPPTERSKCSTVFLNRGPGAHARPVRDFADFAQPGDVVLRPDQMTIQEQVSAVAWADVVVTNCGGGALLSMFAGIRHRMRSSVVLVCGGHEGRLDYMTYEEASWLYPVWYDTERHDCCVDRAKLEVLIDEAKDHACS